MTDVESRLDDLSKAVATGHTRRGILKAGLGVLGAAVATALPGRASAAPGGGNGGNSDCAHFCKTVFPPGPLRGACVSAGAHGGGICLECGADPTRICPGSNPPRCCPPNKTCCGTTACCNAGQFCCPAEDRCVTCRSDQVFNPADCTCGCPAGTEECGGACVPVCPEGTTRNPDTCLCEEEAPPHPECAGATCGGFVPCSSSNSDCVCTQRCDPPGGTPAGFGHCVPGSTSCGPLVTCGANCECPDGSYCAPNTCCGRPVCVPFELTAQCPLDASSFGATSGGGFSVLSFGDGPTIARA